MGNKSASAHIRIELKYRKRIFDFPAISTAQFSHNTHFSKRAKCSVHSLRRHAWSSSRLWSATTHKCTRRGRVVLLFSHRQYLRVCCDYSELLCANKRTKYNRPGYFCSDCWEFPDCSRTQDDDD